MQVSTSGAFMYTVPHALATVVGREREDAAGIGGEDATSLKPWGPARVP